MTDQTPTLGDAIREFIADHKWAATYEGNALADRADSLVDALEEVRELAENYAVRARHAPTPLAQWSDVEADLRRILNKSENRP